MHIRLLNMLTNDRPQHVTIVVRLSDTIISTGN